MKHGNPGDAPNIRQLTKQSVRAFWLDGLWDLAFVGVFVLTGAWGAIYLRFIAYPSVTWPFLREIGRDTVWIGLAVFFCALAAYISAAWWVVRRLKRQLVDERRGYAEHRFFMPIGWKTLLFYFLLCGLGTGLMYGFFLHVSGGLRVLSVAAIISPAVACLVIGRTYGIRRYVWIAVVGFVLVLSLELLITSTASYAAGPANFLDVLPAWGSLALPSFIWAGMFAISGLIGLIGIRRSE
ncbi:MAG TPA: hypothetical protein G4O08_05010, partial [Anaerolineae bacterium]|nr:hypothetical protein [Anaerolineae bacterium]